MSSNEKLLPNGTKEEILNFLAHEPNTITQVAEQLGASRRLLFTYTVSEMLRNELLRDPVVGKNDNGPF